MILNSYAHKIIKIEKDLMRNYLSEECRSMVNKGRFDFSQVLRISKWNYVFGVELRKLPKTIDKLYRSGEQPK